MLGLVDRGLASGSPLLFSSSWDLRLFVCDHGAVTEATENQAAFATPPCC